MISKMSLFIFQITLFIYPRVECRLSIKFNAANTCEFSSFEKLKCGFSKFPHVRAISKPYFSSRISLANKKHVSPCQEARIKKCPTQWNKTTIWDRYNVRTTVWSVPKKKVNFGVRLARWTDFLRSREMSSTVAGKCSDSLIMIYSAAASEMLILTLLICNSCSSFDTDNSIISIRLGASRRR